MKEEFTSMQQKRAHERLIAEKLTTLHFPEYAYERFGNDQGEPDVIFKNTNNSLLGVEVTTAYWEDARELTLNLDMLDAKMCELIAKRVIAKADRSYENVDKTALCIEAKDPASDEVSIASCVLGIHIPPQHPFDYIYVLSYTADGGEYEIFTLYPKED
ncbi:MAG: hypothetical protein ACPGO5_02260 [Patescibacteria group bacterium]